ncbi:dihydroneopterin aldolase [Algivirga pacifica]|uniref:7,8-dihydroneopterin aldolase n=1 Tax=Algivirga pacifica TaxID=1162670 RepID=A0ABP9CX66_9BACT
MDKIALEGMEFFAYHGFYEEEQKIGNKYGVDLEVETDFGAAAQGDTLNDTVNYESLYKITKEVMEEPVKLLEHIAGKIIAKVLDTHASAQTVQVVVRKYNPPIGGVCYASKITMERKRDAV